MLSVCVCVCVCTCVCLCICRTASMSSDRDRQAIKKKLMHMLSDIGSKKENAEPVGELAIETCFSGGRN